jgi:hypothetical protein
MPGASRMAKKEKNQMSKQSLIELEPHQRRSFERECAHLQKTELSAIMASETLVLATALGQVVLSGLERRERQKERRLLLLIACGIAALIGVVRLAIKFVPMN